jgi:hypothetical protein
MAVVGLLAPAPFDLEVICAALAVPKLIVIQSLGELVIYSLLDRIEQRYEVSHSLIHTYARQQLVVQIKSF